MSDTTLNPTAEQIQRLRESVFAQSQRERDEGASGSGVYYPSIKAAETIISAAGLLSEDAPSEEQVERAANALFVLEWGRSGYKTIDDPWVSEGARKGWIEKAHAALTAAAGVAPQEQEEDEDVVVFACGQEIPVSELEAEWLAPQEPSETTYSPATGQWSSTCPCIRAEQVDPECEWHGRPEFRRGGTHHPDTQGPSGEMVAKAARVLHIANCCNLSDSAEHQEPQNEDIYTAGVVLNAIPLGALAAQPVLDQGKVAAVLAEHEYSYSQCGCCCGWSDAKPHRAHQSRALCEAAKRGELSA